MFLPAGIAAQQRRHDGGGGAPVLESSTTYNGGTTLRSNFTITKPTGVVSGDLLVAFMGGTNGITDWVQLAGWTKLQSHVEIGKGNCVQYRIADGTEGADFTFTVTSSSGRVTGSVLRISGASATPFSDNSLRHDTAVGATEDCTNINPAADNCLGVYGVWFGLNTTTKPSVSPNTAGYVELNDFGGSYNSMSIGSNADLGAAGSKACQVAISGGSIAACTLHFLAIKP